MQDFTGHVKAKVVHEASATTKGNNAEYEKIYTQRGIHLSFVSCSIMTS
jgi:hypothetical protein